MAFVIKVQVLTVHFFMLSWGSPFYLFCFMFGFFSCNQEYCSPYTLPALILWSILLSLTIELAILLKIPYSRNYMENLVGKQFLTRYMGSYSGSLAITALLRGIVPSVLLGIIELGGQGIAEHAKREDFDRMSSAIKDQVAEAKKNGQPLTSKQIWELYQENYKILGCPCHGTVTTALKDAQLTEKWKLVSKGLTSVFSGISTK